MSVWVRLLKSFSLESQKGTQRLLIRILMRLKLHEPSEIYYVNGKILTMNKT